MELQDTDFLCLCFCHLVFLGSWPVTQFLQVLVSVLLNWRALWGLNKEVDWVVLWWNFTISDSVLSSFSLGFTCRSVRFHSWSGYFPRSTLSFYGMPVLMLPCVWTGLAIPSSWRTESTQYLLHGGLMLIADFHLCLYHVHDSEQIIALGSSWLTDNKIFQYRESAGDWKFRVHKEKLGGQGGGKVGRASVTKPEDPSSTAESHVVEGKNQFLQTVL